MPAPPSIIAFFAIILVSILSLGASFSLKVTKKCCVVKVCHNKDCQKRGGGEHLLNTFYDLIPKEEIERVVIESSGCLSQCGKGPNVVVIGDDNKEKLYFGVEDPTTASAVLEVATGEEYPINLLVAAASIAEAKHARSPAKEELILTSAIENLTKDGEPTLLNSFAHAHALMLRCDARLEMSPQNIEGAIADAILASQIAPTNGKAWRVMASSLEAGGNIKDAIGALKELARVDPSFSRKANKEIERLSELL